MSKMHTTDQQPIEGDVRELPIPTTDLELIPNIYKEQDELFEEPPVQHTKRSILPLIVVCLLSLLVGTLGMLVVYPLFFQRTTITLYADKQTVQQNVTLADIPLRTLTPVKQVATKTLQTTGMVTRAATQAQGTLVFYNSALVAQTIYAGSALYVGTIEVVTDANVTVPAGTLATNGSAQVTAHTTSAGSAMNIAADTIYGPCCKENIKARNLAFWGGADAVTYHTPTQQDITGAATLLQKSLDGQAQKSVLAQVQNDETLLPTSCTLSTTSDVPPGQAANTVTVTDTEMCTGEIYSTSAVQTQAEQLLGAKAGSMYQPVGEIQTQVTGVDGRKMQVALRGVYAYSISPTDTERLKRSLSGKARQDAYVQLLQMQGVTKVQIQGSSILSSWFPTLDVLPDKSRIDILTQ